uniref:Predicted protein n=1 Tax=Hordeum vulgare subsp. vulgare TaxID=112509 RepID=F2DNT0_HORVV|nr:predicted protein [Hordeum vulgare subsp. vulgare]
MLVLLRPNQAQLTLADTADAGASRDLPRPPWRGDASWPLSTARTGWSASATDIKGVYLLPLALGIYIASCAHGGHGYFIRFRLDDLNWSSKNDVLTANGGC